MNITEAIALITVEHDSQKGLDTLFRLSADVEEERIQSFIEAVQCIEEHYQFEATIERDLVYKLYGFHHTLQASSNHWKVSHPKGLDPKTCFQIHSAIRAVFTD